MHGCTAGVGAGAGGTLLTPQEWPLTLRRAVAELMIAQLCGGNFPPTPAAAPAAAPVGPKVQLKHEYPPHAAQQASVSVTFSTTAPEPPVPQLSYTSNPETQVAALPPTSWRPPANAMTANTADCHFKVCVRTVASADHLLQPVIELFRDLLPKLILTVLCLLSEVRALSAGLTTPVTFASKFGWVMTSWSSLLPGCKPGVGRGTS